MTKFFKRLTLFCLGIILVALPFWSFRSVAFNQPFQEIRGVWLTNIDSDVLFDKKRLSQAIDTLAKHNFNTLYPTVWNWGYTLYPSLIAENVTGNKIDPAEGLQNRDILKDIIRQSHQKNVAVIPWFEFGFMAPADSELAKRHPDWLTQKANEDTIWWEGNVHQRVWLNPLNPNVQQFITDLVTEIVQNYDIEGIQFDDHFGYPADFGYDAVTVQLYQQEHQGKLPPKLTEKLNTGQSCKITNEAWQEWTNWRSQKITAYMNDLFKSIKAIKPNVIISVSPNPQTFSKNCYLLDWQQWEKMGLIEELMIQVYRDNINSFQGELNKPEVKEAKTHIPVGIGILSGLKGRPTSLKMMEDQLNYTRQQKFAGLSFFFYESLWNIAQETPKERQSALQSWFPRSIPRTTLNSLR